MTERKDFKARINRINRINKKAQFYIFIALILCISVYGLLSTTEIQKNNDPTFNLLSKNYVFEANNRINQALYQRADPYTEVDAFTNSFIAYAKTKNTNLGIAYLLKNNNSTKVVNYLKDEVSIVNHNITLRKLESVTLASNRTITLRYDNIDYNYTFTNDTIEFKALIMK